jgi:hypothetical protein
MQVLMEKRKRRSESLSKEEHKAFVKFFQSFPTKVDAEIHFEIKRQVLDLVAIKGSGSPETISKIKAVLEAAWVERDCKTKNPNE